MLGSGGFGFVIKVRLLLVCVWQTNGKRSYQETSHGNSKVVVVRSVAVLSLVRYLLVRSLLVQYISL